MDVFYWPVLVLVVGQLNGKASAGHSLALIIIAPFFALHPPGSNMVKWALPVQDWERHSTGSVRQLTYKNQPVNSLQKVGTCLQSVRRLPHPH